MVSAPLHHYCADTQRTVQVHNSQLCGSGDNMYGTPNVYTLYRALCANDCVYAEKSLI